MAVDSGRRRFLEFSLVAAAGVLGSSRTALAHEKERVIALYNAHTGESLKAVYWAAGEYVAESLQDISVLLRDYRTGDIKEIDPRLIDFLHRLRRRARSRGPYQVVSGYRSPKTNEILRKHSAGVAKRSLHIQGRAVDILLPGVDLPVLHRAALSLRAGGVGYYPNPGFLHLDTGRVRSW